MKGCTQARVVLLVHPGYTILHRRVPYVLCTTDWLDDGEEGQLWAQAGFLGLGEVTSRTKVAQGCDDSSRKSGKRDRAQGSDSG